MKFYISFKINGTKSTIVATTIQSNKEELFAWIKRMRCDHTGFTVISSDQNESRVGWIKLLRKDGTPHISPAWVLRRFKELRKYGWDIDLTDFLNEHYLKPQ